MTQWSMTFSSSFTLDFVQIYRSSAAKNEKRNSSRSKFLATKIPPHKKRPGTCVVAVVLYHRAISVVVQHAKGTLLMC